MSKKKGDGVFNDLIEARMKTLSISNLEDFANFANIGRATIYDLVSGGTRKGYFVKPSIDVLFKLEAALGVSANVLLERLRDKQNATKPLDYGDFVGSHPVGIGAVDFVNDLRD